MKKTKKIPVVPLRGMVILPGRADHFDIGRKRSMAAIEEAMLFNEKVLLVAQRDPDEIDPGAEALFEIGTLCSIRQLARLPQDMGRVMVEGRQRVRINALIPGDDMLRAEVEEIPLIPADASAPASTAMVRVIHDRLSDFAAGDNAFREKHLPGLLALTDINELLVKASALLPLEWESAQKLLEADTVEELYVVLADELTREIQVGEIRRELQLKLKERVDENQRDYILREQLKVLEEELNGGEEDEFSAKVDALEASDDVKNRLKKEITRMRAMPGGSQEASVLRNYIETLLELPWNHVTEDRLDLDRAKEILDEDHYGLLKVKERVLEYLSVKKLNPDGKAPILCLVGPPGTGKTSIARSIARSLDKTYVRVSLGGVRDEAEIRGHRKTYVGAMPGRIVDGLRQAKCANPLMLLDELDKVSPEYRGAAASALLEVLDSDQYTTFRDHYVELPVDLSGVLFIATANTVETIPAPLLDRLEMIELSSYTENEKLHIAREHLIAKQEKVNGIPAGKVEITEDALKKIIRGYTREAGVRNAERKIGDVLRKCAREYAGGRTRKMKVGVKQVEAWLGRERVHYNMAAKEDEVGIVRGLAWTAAGGDTLEIEVNVTSGKGALLLTGRLGEVMQESAKAALSCVRAAADGYGIEAEWFEKHDLHIHIPEGAVPKDGPSAGVTMATALLSAVTEKKVRCDTAMTGEITLRGRVLAVGGLKEKTLAAKNAGLKKVLVPAENKPDIAELSKEITDGLEIVYISKFAEAVKEAFA